MINKIIDDDDLEDEIYGLNDIHSELINYENEESAISMLEEKLIAKKCELKEKKLSLAKKAYRITILDISERFKQEFFFANQVSKEIEKFMSRNGMKIF